MDWELQKQVLNRQIIDTNFLALGVVYPEGKAYYSDEEISDLGDRDYVKKAFEGETNISNLIISRITNKPVLIYAALSKEMVM